MSLRLNGSTSGYSELEAPAVAGDQTFTLPGTGGTLDRLNRAGNILQVVQASTSTAVTVTTTTYTDTDLTASIIPTSATSKVLVIIDQCCNFYASTTSAYGGIRLLRDSTVIVTPVADSNGPYEHGVAAAGATAVEAPRRATIVYLDSPGTTSLITYKTQGRPYRTTNSSTAYFQQGGPTNNPTSFITLIEVAQ